MEASSISMKDGLKLMCRYSVQDWVDFQVHLEDTVGSDSAGRLWFETKWFEVGSWLTLFLVFFFYCRYFVFSWPTAAIVAFFFICLATFFILKGNKIRKYYAPSEQGSFIGEHQFLFDGQGVHVNGKGYHTMHEWALMIKVMRTEKAIYLYLDSDNAYIFPLSQLDDPDAFYEYLQSKITVTNLAC